MPDYYQERNLIEIDSKKFPNLTLGFIEKLVSELIEPFQSKIQPAVILRANLDEDNNPVIQVVDYVVGSVFVSGNSYYPVTRVEKPYDPNNHVHMHIMLGGGAIIVPLNPEEKEEN